MDIDSEVIKKNICFVLPTYNEEGNIENTIENILVEEKKQNKYVFTVLVVDDNSTDHTQPIVRRIIESKDNINLVTGEKKGLGDAYKRGFLHAVEILEADIIFQMDSVWLIRFAFSFPLIKSICDNQTTPF